MPAKKIEFLVVTDQIINQSFRVQNLRKLMEASINPKYYIEIKRNVNAILVRNPKIKLKRLVELVNIKSLPDDTNEDDIWTAIYGMVIGGIWQYVGLMIRAFIWYFFNN